MNQSVSASLPLQNWIGGSSPTDARFVPPPVDQMQSALDEWEVAIHAANDLPALVRIGLLHAQFETIYPFIDGNGRVGRLLITFLLTEWGVLRHPLLHLSGFLRRHVDEYYHRLQSIRDEGDWEGGCASSSTASQRWPLKLPPP